MPADGEINERDPGAMGIAALFKVLRYSQLLSARDPIDIAALKVLGALAELGPSRPSDLATVVHLDLSTVSRHLAALETQQLVRKSRDPSDGRASRVELTQDGTDLLAEMFARRAQAIAPVLDDWSDQDRDQLFELLIRLSADLQVHVQERTP